MSIDRVYAKIFNIVILRIRLTELIYMDCEYKSKCISNNNKPLLLNNCLEETILMKINVFMIIMSGIILSINTYLYKIKKNLVWI